MEIKTIRNRLDNAECFDRDVNAALAAGWTLKQKYVIPGTGDHFTMLIALLTKGEPEAYLLPVREYKPEPLTIKVKYFDPTLPDLQKITAGDWIDLRSAERVELQAGKYHVFRLGVGMILPDGYEAIIAPRSSTPERFGIVCPNSIGVVDNSYSGNNDEWRFPAVAIRDTIIEKGDRIAQFRIIKNQPAIKFETVDHLNEISRGGIGSTGRK